MSMATVNKTAQTVESAAGTFHIEDVYPSIDGGRYPVKRIVGERVDVYRDGHEVVVAPQIRRGQNHHQNRPQPQTK